MSEVARLRYTFTVAEAMADTVGAAPSTPD